MTESYKGERHKIECTSSGCARAGDTKFIPNLKIEYFIRNDSNGFLNMNVFCAAVTVDSFIFAVEMGQKGIDLCENNTALMCGWIIIVMRIE